MHLYPIVIVAIVLVADGASFKATEQFGIDGAWITATAVGVPIVLLAMFWLMIRAFRRQADRHRDVHAILKAGRLGRLVRGMIVAHHALVIIGLGWLSVIRSVTGDLLLVDELIAMLPPIAGLAGTWWVDYPIERRLRNAMLIRRLDSGSPVYPTPGRWAHVLMQLRMQLLPLLAPLLLIAAFGELIRNLAVGIDDDRARFWIGEGATIVAAAGVFVIAPLLARLMLSVRSLPDTPLRRELLNVCARHNVKVRDVLVWDTGGVMINAAVMGLLGRLRYILMTDALLDTMDRRQLVAVMAHEIGHVRKHHMPWMIVALIAILTAASLAVWLPLAGLHALGATEVATSMTAEGVATFLALAIAFLVFGWVSRRFERQADTFAVRHFSEHGMEEIKKVEEVERANSKDDQTQDGGATFPSSSDGGRAEDEHQHDAHGAVPPAGAGGLSADEGRRYAPNGAITSESVHIMQSALETIAELNMVDPHRRSWRHGSIAWRQQYLQSLVGAPQGRLPIDRTVAWIKVVSAIVLVCGLGLQVVMVAAAPEQRASSPARQSAVDAAALFPSDVCDASALRTPQH